MNVCPVCGSRRVVRSRTRLGLESVRRRLTTRRPYRCFNCKWRGWVDEAGQVTPLGDASDVPPELVAQDAVLEDSSKKAGR